ncbi:MAG: phage holin family protein [Candidatus Eremiobacteraeota bacterium]|nr:phage holin family protein [Candidatus Eremiobacteraeota bacterium]
MRSDAPAEADRSIPELLQKLAAETSLLVRQEVELARAEILATLKKAAAPGAAFGVAAIFALGAFGALTALLIIALGLVLPLWASALIVTCLYAAIAAFAVRNGRAELKKIGTPVPQQTMKTIKEDIATVQSSIRRGR